VNPYAEQLADATDAVTAAWARRSIRALLRAAGVAEDDRLTQRIEQAAGETESYVRAALREFLALDVDDQRTNPLAVLRSAVRFPTAALREAGVPEVRRDEFEVRSFPDDVYRLSPATWNDIDESLQEPGIIWGAWKAKTVLDRRRAEGKR